MVYHPSQQNLLPFGRFCFNRLPSGISSTPKHYFQKRVSQVLKGTDGALCQVVDILVFDKTTEEHDEHL